MQNAKLQNLNLLRITRSFIKDKDNMIGLLQLLKEANNPQAGKAAPYGSGYAKVIQQLVKEVLAEKVKGVDGKACWKGYRYAGTKNGKDICIKITK